MSVEHSLKVIDEMAVLVCDIIQLIEQKGVNFGSIPQIFQIVGDLKNLALDAPLVLPELEKWQELDPAEVGSLGGASYSALLKIISQVKAK